MAQTAVFRLFPGDLCTSEFSASSQESRMFQSHQWPITGCVVRERWGGRAAPPPGEPVGSQEPWVQVPSCQL